MPRARSRLSIGFVGCLALGFAATGASATVLGPSLDALKPAMPRFDLEKVHEGHGGMHPGLLPAQGSRRLP
jgi:hypothetical protein